MAFFSEKTGPLFCRMLDYCSVNQLEEYGVVIKEFLIEQKAVLNYALDSATRSDSLKERLNKIDFECEKLSDYKDSILNFLIENAFFVVSKTNLDYILANQNVFLPGAYYDYVRNHEKIKNKVMRKSQIEDFVNLLVDNDEIRISQEGIVDLLFSSVILSDSEKTEKIVNKLKIEYVDLTCLSKIYRNDIGLLPDFSTGTIHCLISQNKVKVDFNNLLYVSRLGYGEDVILFAKRELEREKGKHVEIDAYARDVFLVSFFRLLIIDSRVDLSLFKAYSLFLINQKIDIIGLVSLDIVDSNNVSTEKMKILVELSLKNNFDYFCKRFEDIKKKFKNYWFMNMAYLLRNENRDRSLKDCVLNESQISALIKQISLDDFAKIMKIWIGLYGIEDSSRIVERILNKKRIRIWNDVFGYNSIKNFLDNYNYSFDDRVVGKIKNYLDEIQHVSDGRFKEESENKSNLIRIANKFGLGKRAIVDYWARTESGRELVWLLKESSLNQYKIDVEIKRFFEECRDRNVKRASVNNDMFIIGRFFYMAMDRGACSFSTLLSCWRDSYSGLASDYLLIGAVFESYFDHELLKTSQKKMHFDDLLKLFERSCSKQEIGFVRRCLTLYKERFIYFPGDDNVEFDIVYNKDMFGKVVDSIEYNHVSILADYSESRRWSESDQRNSSEIAKLPNTISIDELKDRIRNYFTIPEYRISIYYSDSTKNIFPQTITFANSKMFKKIEDIAHQVNKNKTDETLF